MNRLHTYGIYAVPRGQHIIYNKANPYWGGIHITIVGFRDDHPAIKINLEKISNRLFKTDWKLKKYMVRKNGIFVKSSTLDKISKILNDKGFKNIKGPIYAKNGWHLTFDTKKYSEITEMLEKEMWDLVIVKEDGDNHIWLERCPLRTF